MLQEIIEKGDEMLQQTLSEAMDKLCATLVFYLREKEVNVLIESLVANLKDPSGTSLQVTTQDMTDYFLRGLLLQ